MAKRKHKSIEQQAAELNEAVVKHAVEKRRIAKRRALGLQPPNKLFGFMITNDEPGVFIVSKDGAEVARCASSREAQEAIIRLR